MPLKDPITRKIIARLDRIDRQVLEQHLTELAETNQLYCDLLTELPEGVILLDAGGAIQWLNNAALDLTGLPAGTMKRGQRWVEDLPDPALAAFLRRFLPAVERKTVETLSILRPRERHLRFIFIPVKNGGGATTAIWIADQTRAENESLERERFLRLEDLMNLTAGIAHEIGNPLNALSIHMQLLKKEAKALAGKNAENFSSRLQIMESEIKRLDQIIRSFLKATRRPPLRLNVENLNDLLEEVIAVIEPEAKRGKVTIEFQDDKKLPPFLMDRARLYQALLNLIKNGIEAMPQGGRLLLRLTHRERLAALRIEDKGVGIREEDMQHIFSAFYTTKSKGTGLGLMSVLETISEHGGKIDVSSKPGKGTVFTLYLPLRMPKLQIPKAP